jgi:hypothetical protein
MSMSFLRRAALVLPASAVLVAVATLPAWASSNGWRVNATYSLKGGEDLATGVDAVSAKDAWSVALSEKKNGSSLASTIRHWNGKSWSQVNLPSKVAKAWDNSFPAEAVIGASSTKNVWVVGALERGEYLRLNGSKWSAGRLPGSGSNLVEATSVQVFSAKDVWVFGGSQSLRSTSESVKPYAAMYDGSKWTRFAVPGSGFIGSVSAASRNSIWAVTGGTPLSGLTTGTSTGTQVVVHWTGSAWQEPTQPTAPTGEKLSLTSVLAEQGGTVLVAGSVTNSHKGTSPTAVSWNGTTWSAPSEGPGSTAKWDVTSVASDGHSGVWAVANASNRGTSELLHLTGTKWSVVKPDFGKHAWVLLGLSAVPHSQSVWGAGALKEGTSAAGLIAIEGPTPK